MATATLPQSPQTKTSGDVLSEFLEMIGGMDPKDLDAFKERLEKRKKVKELGAYHQCIIDRVFPKPGYPVPELPDGKYESYLILSSRHYRTEKNDLQLAREDYQKRCKQADQLGHPRPEFPEVRVTEYVRGQNITPQDDGEALMMLQDPDKFRPLRGGEQDRIATLLTEANSKDARIAELEAQLANAQKKNSAPGR